MARVKRSLTVVENFSVHKVWRGHNKEWNLETDSEKLKYLELLNDDLESEVFDSGCEPQAICIMSNHTHELFKILRAQAFSNCMRRYHSRYGMYFNKKKNRCGKVAQDRAKTCQIADKEHEMKVVFYIHANPIRANIVKDARNYPFSTHKLYAFGIRDRWMRNIKLPQWYLALGRTAALRQRRYRKLFNQFLKDFGRKKQTFLNKLFFGPTLWMMQKQEMVRQWRRENHPP